MLWLADPTKNVTMPSTDKNKSTNEGVSVIIPAHNEAGYIGACLDALLASENVISQVEVVVVTNGCTDNTALVARAFEERAGHLGWVLKVIELEHGGKMGALNAGDQQAMFGTRMYLDADVAC